MRIAYVGLRAPWGCDGGVEAAIAQLAPRVAAAGHTVTVYCRQRYNPHGNTTMHGVRLVDTPTIHGRSTEAIVHTLLATPRAALHHDLIHIQAAGPGLCAPIPRLLGRASVVTLHGEDWSRDKWGFVARSALRLGAEAAARGASEVIAVNTQLAARFGATHIPNGVAPHPDVPWDPTRFPELQPGAYHLFVGRLVPEKGLETLLRAAERARTRMPIVIVGGTAYTEAWADQLRAGAPAGVHFLGPRHGDEKSMLLGHARSFVLPSRVEGLPVALLEACAAARACLASDIPGNREVLGDMGFYAGVGDVDGWAAALESLEAAPDDELRAIGEAARRRTFATFDWDNILARTLAVYEQAVARR